MALPANFARLSFANDVCLNDELLQLVFTALVRTLQLSSPPWTGPNIFLRTKYGSAWWLGVPSHQEFVLFKREKSGKSIIIQTSKKSNIKIQLLKCGQNCYISYRVHDQSMLVNIGRG